MRREERRREGGRVERENEREGCMKERLVGTERWERWERVKENG